MNIETIILAANIRNLTQAIATIATYKMIQKRRKLAELHFYGNRTKQLEELIRELAAKMHLLETHERFHGIQISKYLSY